jgi:hypothetical protein
VSAGNTKLMSGFGFWFLGHTDRCPTCHSIAQREWFGSFSRCFLANGIELDISAEESSLAENWCSHRTSRRAEIDYTHW